MTIGDIELRQLPDKSEVGTPRTPVSPYNLGEQRRTPENLYGYRNNLLLAVGFLDLANAMDFPANVWNERVLPIYAKVLMGLGGSIIILASSIAICDFIRCLRNVRFLHRERHWLKEQERAADTPEERRTVKAWLLINRRELGWEYFDRMSLDVCMGISAVLVGPGTLLAIRGDIHPIWRASNLLSGYVGNSFMPVNATIITIWNFYMWQCAYRHRLAINKIAASLEPSIIHSLLGRAVKHQMYAMLIGLSMWVTAVGSMMSATMWHGYVVLIPSIIGSIIATWFWRAELGYNRQSCQDWNSSGMKSSILEQYRASTIALSLWDKQTVVANFPHTYPGFPSVSAFLDWLRNLGAEEDFCESIRLAHSTPCSDGTDVASVDRELFEAGMAFIKHRGPTFFSHQQRFLEELYGHWLCVSAGDS